MPKPTQSFEIWDIVRVPFPKTYRPIQQHRPALVIGRHAHPQSPALLWVLMITSATHRPWHGDVPISDLTQSSLPAPSIIRTAKIATIEAAEAQRLGTLPANDRKAVQTILPETLR